MKTLGLAIAALAFAGCAATTAQPATPAATSTATATPLTGNYSFPSRVSDDGIRDAVADYEQLVTRSYNGSVEAQVNVCVKPSGSVEKASIVSTSGIVGFDRALADVASSWKYEPVLAANAETECKTVSVIYQSRI